MTTRAKFKFLPFTAHFDTRDGGLFVYSSYAVLRNGRRLGEVHQVGRRGANGTFWFAYTDESEPQRVGFRHRTRREAAEALETWN